MLDTCVLWRRRLPSRRRCSSDKVIQSSGTDLVPELLCPTRLGSLLLHWLKHSTGHWPWCSEAVRRCASMYEQLEAARHETSVSRPTDDSWSRYFDQAVRIDAVHTGQMKSLLLSPSSCQPRAELQTKLAAIRARHDLSAEVLQELCERAAATAPTRPFAFTALHDRAR